MALTRPLINNLNTNIEIFNDTITVLHGNASIANSDIGLLMNRAGGLVPNAAFYWNETTQAFVTALTSNTGVGYSNITATSYANITTGSLNASSVTASGTVVATGFYYPNGQNVSTGFINLGIYLNKATATNTAYTLVDSLSNVGNTSVRWTVSSSDNVYSNFKMSTIDAVTNGANVYYTEYGVLQNTNSANVATFTSNVYNGLISLWALGASSNVTVAFERETLGTGLTPGYLSSTGPQGATGATGATGTVANTSGYIYTSNLTAATSTTTGALQVAGGAGIAGNVYIGSNAYFTSGIKGLFLPDTGSRLTFGMQDANSSIYGAYFSVFGNNYSDSTQRGSAQFITDTRNSATAGFTVGRYNGSSWTTDLQADVNGNIIIKGTTASTSTTTGILQVAGGAGIVGNLFVGGNTTTLGTVTAANLYITSNATSGTTTRVEANIPHPFMLMGAA